MEEQITSRETAELAKECGFDYSTEANYWILGTEIMEYKLKKGKFIKNGHTMFEKDVLTDLKRLAHLEEQVTKGKIVDVGSVVFSEAELARCNSCGENPNTGSKCDNVGCHWFGG